MNIESKYLNDGRFVIEGVISLSSGAAVNTVTAGTASKTVTGQFMSCVKNGTGRYDVTVKLASSLDGKPIFQPVEFLGGYAHIVATTVATALWGRLLGAPTVDANGNLVISVITAQTTGAAADTTAAVLVSFQVVLCTQRMDPVF
jgi:hypothetical protein